MNSEERVQRFAIRFDDWYASLSSMLFLSPSRSYIELRGDDLEVRMAWAFRAHFPRAAVVSVRESDARPISRGVHGFAGRWLVNGSSRGILLLELSPPQRGHVLGFPVRLRELLVSVDEPQSLAALLANRSTGNDQKR